MEKSLPETEDYLNEMPGSLAVFDLYEILHYCLLWRWKTSTDCVNFSACSLFG